MNANSNLRRDYNDKVRNLKLLLENILDIRQVHCKETSRGK